MLHRPSTSRSLTQSAPASESTIAVESTNLREGNDDALDGKVTEAVNTPSVNASDGNLNSPSPSQEPDVSLTPMLDVNLTDGNDGTPSGFLFGR